MISPGGNWLKMDGIKSGSVTNHIRVDCIGDALTVYANGKQVSDSYDHTFVGGDAGLVARSSRLEGGVDIQFDNFIVNKPRPAIGLAAAHQGPLQVEPLRSIFHSLVTGRLKKLRFGERSSPNLSFFFFSPPKIGAGSRPGR